ncbi:hypothetical protein [Oryza sativa Japonica Group]|uniref:Uncharacterized protein n=1 Tax=Oryza sativa subsp. japonica TaxID=39947 RepID=Q5VR35_ORYSJ|nr:hypothetical protein [Oryza sativa Japonica Group]BAD68090.1 hypothetical protein [Oryza sativa Japonica Group]
MAQLPFSVVENATLRTFLAKCSRSMPPSLAPLPLPPAPVVATVGVGSRFLIGSSSFAPDP